MKLVVALFAGVLLIAPSLCAARALCYTEKSTREKTCIDPSAVTVNGDLRASPTLTGGPSGVSKTGLTMVVNCKNGITTLQNRSGINVAGSTNDASYALTVMSNALCEVHKPKVDKRLRQFGS